MQASTKRSASRSASPEPQKKMRSVSEQSAPESFRAILSKQLRYTESRTAIEQNIHRFNQQMKEHTPSVQTDKKTKPATQTEDMNTAQVKKLYSILAEQRNPNATPISEDARALLRAHSREKSPAHEVGMFNIPARKVGNNLKKSKRFQLFSKFFSLEKDRLDETRRAMKDGETTRDFLDLYAGQWLTLDQAQMFQTRSALKNSYLAQSLQENIGSWVHHTADQMADVIRETEILLIQPDQNTDIAPHRPESAKMINEEKLSKICENNPELTEYIIENPEIWSNLDNAQISVISFAFQSGGEVKQMIQEKTLDFLQLSAEEMIKKINQNASNLLSEADENAPGMIAKNINPRQNLTEDQMRMTRTALQSNVRNGLFDYIKENPNHWSELNENRMNATFSALSNGDNFSAFMMQNPKDWLNLSETQQAITRENLFDGGKAKDFIEQNPEVWIGMNAEQMTVTTQALNNKNLLSERIAAHPESWKEMPAERMREYYADMS